MKRTVNVKSLGDYSISLDQDDFIGHGTYAKVSKAFFLKNTQQELIGKQFELGDSERFRAVCKQIKMAAELPKHSNLVHYKKTKVTEKHLYIIMEPGQSSLKKQMMSKKGNYSEKQVWAFLGQFCEGYKILMRESIVHREIKPENILIGSDGKYKITDYGLREVVNLMQELGMVTGKYEHCAPELLADNPEGKIGSINDVYSLGVTVFEMCFKRLPYFGTKKNFAQKKKFLAFLSSNKLKLPKTNPYSHCLTSLILSMLEINENKRCTWEFIFFTLMGQSPQKSMSSSLNSKSAQELSSHDVSTLLLNNLSHLDASSKQLESGSITAIDHIYADVIAKRQIITFCGNLQDRLQSINSKLVDKLLGQFNVNLLKIVVLLANELLKYLQKFQEKLSKIGLMEIVPKGDKHSQIRTLIYQDHQKYQTNLKKAQICMLQSDKQNDPKNMLQNEKENGLKQSIPKLQKESMLESEILVYQMSERLIKFLYNHKHYQQCILVGELEKWLQDKQRSSGALGEFRKNQSYCSHFEQMVNGVPKQKMKDLISPIYLFTFTQLDKSSKQKDVLKCG